MPRPHLYLLAALLAAFGISHFSDRIDPYHLDVIIGIGINIILAVSLNLVNGYTGQFSLGHAAFFGAGAYAVGINRLLNETLKYASDTPYLVTAPLWKNWGWKGFENRYVNVGHCLRQTLQANPLMRVYVASGYFDLATPHAAGDHTLAHLGLRDRLADNIKVSYFEAGHMMYIHPPSLARMAQELRVFVAAG